MSDGAYGSYGEELDGVTFYIPTIFDPSNYLFDPSTIVDDYGDPTTIYSIPSSTADTGQEEVVIVPQDHGPQEPITIVDAPPGTTIPAILTLQQMLGL
jgi:hypothetical protein